MPAVEHERTSAIRLFLSLPSCRIEREDVSPREVRTWGGMKGLALPVLLERVSSGTDPLGPENPLIFAAGLLNGLAFSGVCRYGVYARSPLTGAYGESEAGGSFGPALRTQGVDALVVEGASERSVYLWVENGTVVVCDAEDLWGLGTKAALEKLQERHGKITAALIGPAGERRVRYACIVNDLRHANGRCGLGAVMGSKRIKAVVCPAPKPETPADREMLRKCHDLFKDWQENPLASGLREFGTPGGVVGLNTLGILPTRNFRSGTFEAATEIGGQVYNERFLQDRGSCFACSIRCKRVTGGGRYDADPTFGGPEYETVASFGSLCGIEKLDAVVKAHERCNDLGLDTISAGMTIAWLMECVEEGVLSPSEAGVCGFGDEEGMLRLLSRIAAREGIGDLLAEGSKRASERLGGESGSFVLTVKGQELPMHDPRGKVGVALGYACAAGGADHMQFAHDTLFVNPEGFPLKSVACLGVLDPMDPLAFDPAKIVADAYLWSFWSVLNHLGGCFFVFAPRSHFPIPALPYLVRAGTGWDTSLWELLKIGERGITATRLLNLRLGFSDEDDMLPPRLFDPLPEGALAGKTISREAFLQARTLLYGIMGWDERGVPLPGKVEELGLSRWTLGHEKPEKMRTS